MRTTGVTQTVLDYLLWHHLGDDFAERAHDILQVMTRRGVFQVQSTIIGVALYSHGPSIQLLPTP